eukprot:GEMP01016440.1.p1 GENE.GEMP01016440.1~~GEMP01016440.1.p1  ORF type:complete len:678 (+),score=129.06 GEMP01016440.1:67-2100(+)
MPIVRHLLIKYVVPQYRVITFAGFFAGLITIMVFHQFDRRTELEEHGLIAGHFNSEFGRTWSNALDKTIAEVNKAESVADALNATLSRLPSHPLYEIPYATKWVNGSNYYTVVQSSRGDSREAIILVISTHAWSLGVQPSAVGIAVGLILVQYLRQVNWLSKDILVIFSDRTVPYAQNIRSFLETYTSGSIPMVRRGVLRQAVVAEIDSTFDSVHLRVDGINGMLPNQDLVNAFMIEAQQQHLLVVEPKPWKSVSDRLFNGGVHNAHSAFLEYQVPAFTAQARKGTKKTSGNQRKADALVKSLEGLLHDMSNILQQLHHSFNFYFYNSPNSHVSTGIYLYPLFFMLCPLGSYLVYTPPFIDDIRSLICGMSTVLALIAFCGGVPFLLATNSFAAGAFGLQVPTCDGTREGARETARMWLMIASCGILFFAVALRRWAWIVWEGDNVDQGAKKHFTIPYPLWNTMTCASGCIFGFLLAPLAMYNWAMALPFTVIIVPILLIMTPWSSQRLVRSVVLALFLLSHVVPFLEFSPDNRALVARSFTQLDHNFKQLVKHSGIPHQMAVYLPTHLVSFLFGKNGLINILDVDPFEQLYTLAEHYTCVHGALFPLFCFLYVPFFAVVFIVSVCLPSQKVDPQKISALEFLIYTVSVVVIVLAAFTGGIVWRSFSSAGLGSLKWS